jgi:N-sulfoglucosamine sulfohydrolase
MNHPNVICIVSSYHGRDDFGYRGSAGVRTPYLDALAEHGLSFTQTFAASADSDKSRRVHLLGASGRHDEPLLPDLMSGAGYETGFAGVWDHTARPLASLGFDWTDGFCSDTIPAPEQISDEGNRYAYIGDGAVRFLQGTPAPFFLYVSFADAQPEGSAEYQASAALMDKQVGRILATLSSRGHTNTTILFMGLRGCAGSDDRDSPSEKNLQVPFIVSGAPGQRRGETDTSLVTTADLSPTLLELCNLSPPYGIAGESVAKRVFDTHVTGRDLVCAQWDPRTRYGRNEQVKLIESMEPGRTAMYDIQADPEEKRNLFGLPKYIVHQVKLSQAMAATLGNRADHRE